MTLSSFLRLIRSIVFWCAHAVVTYKIYGWSPAFSYIFLSSPHGLVLFILPNLQKQARICFMLTILTFLSLHCTTIDCISYQPAITTQKIFHSNLATLSGILSFTSNVLWIQPAIATDKIYGKLEIFVNLAFYHINWFPSSYQICSGSWQNVWKITDLCESFFISHQLVRFIIPICTGCPEDLLM